MNGSDALWHTGEPNNNGGEENCLDMWIKQDNTHQEYRLNDYLGYARVAGICQLPSS